MQDADSVAAFVQHVIFNVPDLVPSPDQEYIHTLIFLVNGGTRPEYPVACHGAATCMTAMAHALHSLCNEGCALPKN